MLIGRLTAKPELRYTGSNLPFARFSVAVNRTFNNAQGQRETDFINVVVWRKQAENVCNFLNKGSLVSVEGNGKLSLAMAVVFVAGYFPAFYFMD